MNKKEIGDCVKSTLALQKCVAKFTIFATC